MNTQQKHKKILSNLKKYYKENDDIWDKELIDSLITEYFVVEEFKGNSKIKTDKHLKWEHSLLVRTSMFWGVAKHLNKSIATSFWKQLYNL